MLSESDRDWPQDYADGENKYVCTCIDCTRPFYGHKRRAICHRCATPPALPEEVRRIEERCKGIGKGNMHLWPASAKQAQHDRATLLQYIKSSQIRGVGRELTTAQYDLIGRVRQDVEKNNRIALHDHEANLLLGTIDALLAQIGGE